jgi:cell wall-associated NlpC family hydrolase
MLKNPIFLLSVICLATSCSSLRSSTSGTTASSASGNTQSSSNGSIQFINTISIKPDAQQDKTGASMETVNTTNNNTTDNAAGSSGTTVKYSALQFKYAILEDAKVEDLDNPKLLDFMEEWYGTHYHYGGTTKDGIDCSAFANSLMLTVYGVSGLPRTAREQYAATMRIRRDDLQEGDLVFFHTLGKHRAVTHVGVYLRNNKFIHASISGVMISDMNDGYYDKHYIGAGRVLNPGS